MFLKINEFDTSVAVPVLSVRPRWPAPFRVLLGLAFLVAWLPVTLLCWVGLTAIIAMKIGVDAADYAGDAILGPDRRG